MLPRFDRDAVFPALAGVLPHAVLFAERFSWQGFKKYWAGYFGTLGGVIWIVMGVAALALFIITRGKWRS